MSTLKAITISFALMEAEPYESESLTECRRNDGVAYVHAHEDCAKLDERAFIASQHRSDDPLVMAAIWAAREVVRNISMSGDANEILGEKIVEDFSHSGMRGLASIAVDWSNLLGDHTFLLEFYSVGDGRVFLYVDPVAREHEWALSVE